MSDFELRRAARETVAELMDPATPVAALADVPTVGQRLSLPTQVHPKAQRYAVGAALTGTFMSELLVGDERQARFRQLPITRDGLPNSPHDPYTLLVHDMQLAAEKAHQRLKDPSHTRREHVQWLAAEYDRLTEQNPSPETNVPVKSAEIFRGSEGPFEVSNYVLYIAHVCSRNAELANLPPQEWWSRAHDHSTALIGRASTNIAAFTSRALVEVNCERMRLKRLGDRYVLDTDGQFSHAPAPGARHRPIISPTMKCLAHMVKKDPEDSASALKKFIHAGINAAHDRGLFNGDLAQRVWEQRVRDGWQGGRPRPKEETRPTGL